MTRRAVTGIDVLCADGDDEFAAAVATALSRAEDTLETAVVPDRRRALAALDDADCLVCGRELPGGDGVEFARRVDERFPGVPVVLLVEGVSEGVVLEAVEAGVADCLPRSAAIERADVVAARVRELVDRRRWSPTAIGREVSDRAALERQLRALHGAGAEIQGADSIEAACRLTVDAAASLLEFDICTVMVHEDGLLVPKAVSADAPADGARPMRTDQGLAGETFRSGEGRTVDDTADCDVADPARASYRSGLSVPVGDRGVFQAVHTEPGEFDSDDIERAELLLQHTENALERIARQRRLERQNERLNRFASVLSHDLRSPLTVADGRIELARAECDSEHLGLAADAIARMETLIDELLVVANEGHAPDDPEPVSLPALVNRCWHTVETAGSTLETDIEGRVRADRSQLARVFENLFRNAVEHGSTRPGSETRRDAVEHGSTSPGSETRRDAVEHGSTSPGSNARRNAVEHDPLEITVGRLPDGFYVADDGPGIPPDERDRVFEPGHSTSEDGTGYGLWIVEEIVTAHGWTVDATESATGGARFEITGVEFVD